MSKNKKGFTLFELIIVIILFSITIGFISINTNLLTATDKQNTFLTIKQILLNYAYEKSISLKCTLDEDCFLFIDDELDEKKISFEISDDIEVYEYNDRYEEIQFKDVEPKELESYNVVFELTLNKDKKHKDMIVRNDNKIYVFNNIYKTPLVFDSLSDVSDYFDKLKEEVKDSAF